MQWEMRVQYDNGLDGYYLPKHFTENQQRAIEHIIANAGKDPIPPSEATPTPEAAMHANREAAKAQAKERAQQARGMGYTGDLCPQCGSDKMKRNGSCLCCESCGATTGCS